MKAIDRFMDKVAVADNGCWEWQAGKNSGGYGKFKHEGKDHGSHRWSYEYYVGEIPDGMCVCHKCDVRHCVNPDHLFLGTYQDNAVDMISKGRGANLKGESNNNSCLSENSVRLMKMFLKRHPAKRGINGGQCNFLSRWFDVHLYHVIAINTGKRWRHIT